MNIDFQANAIPRVMEGTTIPMIFLNDYIQRAIVAAMKEFPSIELGEFGCVFIDRGLAFWEAHETNIYLNDGDMCHILSIEIPVDIIE